MKTPGSILTTLALALALRPEALAEEKQPKSPQDNIVRKYNLEGVLEKAQNNYELGTGCRQPLNTKEEKELFKDFRQLAERAKTPDALLLICKSVLGIPAWSGAFLAQHDPNIVRTQNPALFEREQRASLLGHELTHIVNKDNYNNAQRDIVAFERDIAILKQIEQARREAGNPMLPTELNYINRAIRIEGNRLDTLIAANQELETNADIGGVILKAGPACKIDIKSMQDGLQNVLGKGYYSTDAGITHPSLRERKDELYKNRSGIADACRDYYADPKKNKPNKTPSGGGRGR